MTNNNRPKDGRTAIEVTAGNLDLTADEADAAVVASGLPIYQRAGSLVRPVRREVTATQGRTVVTVGIGKLDLSSGQDVLSAAANFLRFDGRKEEWRSIDPPERVIRIWLSREGRWQVPHIAGVISTPTMRPDGSIHNAPGYDPVTRLFHEHDDNVILSPIVASPTRANALAALDLLKKLLIEFPFVNDVALSVALSCLITPVVRGAMRVVPLHVITARTAGTGKSYLADVASAIAIGRPCPVISAAPDDEIETEKRLVGLLLAGFPLLNLDNINGELGGDLLCQATERPFIQIRPLGKSDIVEIENCATILATGNNLTVRGDLTRRTIKSNLDAGLERPELRQFTFDPVATVLNNRGQYVSAVLIICRAYILAGRPRLLPVLASFSDWSNLVRSALVWLGCADPVASMEEARDNDPEIETIREIMAAWNDANGTIATTCKRTIALAAEKGARPDANGDVSPYAPQNEPRFPNLHDALARVAMGRQGLDVVMLGNWLRRTEGRLVDGQKFQRDGATEGSARWKLGNK